jgi:hypothetical protein
MVRERGLEPPPLTGPDPKSGVSAISPLAQQRMPQHIRQFSKCASDQSLALGFGSEDSKMLVENFVRFIWFAA